MSPINEKYMHNALQCAQQAAEQEEVPVGAIVVWEGNIIGEGWNQSIQQNDCSAHAEIIALRAAGRFVGNYRLPGAVLYVTLEPCAMCVGAIVHSRVAKVVFGATDPKTGALGGAFSLLDVVHHNHKPAIMGGVLEQQCGSLLREFFRFRR